MCFFVFFFGSIVLSANPQKVVQKYTNNLYKKQKNKIFF